MLGLDKGDDSHSVCSPSTGATLGVSYARGLVKHTEPGQQVQRPGFCVLPPVINPAHYIVIVQEGLSLNSRCDHPTIAIEI